jgi:hypothetical protein
MCRNFWEEKEDDISTTLEEDKCNEEIDLCNSIDQVLHHNMKL